MDDAIEYEGALDSETGQVWKEIGTAQVTTSGDWRASETRPP